MKGYVVRITFSLLDAATPIWRRVIMPSAATLRDLHNVIQAAMGWYGYHLHHFEIGGLLYGDATSAGEFGDTEVLSETRLKLCQLVQDGERQFTYVYDYGDNWCCSIVLEAMYPAFPGIPYPCLDGGAGAAPPEDSGGVWGLEELIAALHDPEHERHEEAVERLGEDYNPEDYDEEAVARALEALVKRPVRPRSKASPNTEN
jgi:hypothetical protein